MLVENEIIQIIEAHTGLQCYLDVIPNSVTLPALMITNLNYDTPLNGRILSGRKTGNQSEHRLGLVCSTMSQLDDLVKQVKLLDNTDNQFFQKLYLDFSLREPREEGGNVVRAFYNLTATK